MPQMSPFNWTLMFLLFLMSLALTTSKIYPLSLTPAHAQPSLPGLPPEGPKLVSWLW